MSVTRLYRIGNKLHRLGVPGAALFFKALIRLIYNCAVDPRTIIGKESFFAYSGIAVVIHRNCVIGDNVTISQCVTIGGRSGMKNVPRIGDDVFIGAGAIILGDIVIGSGSIIGAGAVVLNSTGENEVWAGVPARKIKNG